MELKEKRFSSGQTIFKQGEKGGELHFVKEGKVRLMVKDADTGAEAQVAIAEAPTVLGTLTFLEDEPRSASGIAETDVIINIVGPAQREKMLAQVPKWFNILIKDMTSTIRRLNAEYARLKTENVEWERKFQALRRQLKDQREGGKEEK